MDQDGDVLSVGIPDGGVLVEGRADGILDGLWDGDVLSVGLDEGGFDVEGLADVGSDVEGLVVGTRVGGTVGRVGFRVVGLTDVGLDVEGLRVGLLVGLRDVGLDVEGLFVGLSVGLRVGICVELQAVALCSLFVGLYVSSVGL